MLLLADVAIQQFVTSTACLGSYSLTRILNGLTHAAVCVDSYVLRLLVLSGGVFQAATSPPWLLNEYAYRILSRSHAHQLVRTGF